MQFGLFDTWNAIYEGGKVPWDPEYSGGKLLEKEAYTVNFEQIDAIEDGGWDYLLAWWWPFFYTGKYGSSMSYAGREFSPSVPKT
ncbi:MAG: hypothetical protein Ct9H300mP27_12090 [Chloroflexota bacterium]|nr:MAG: hypothetical protein Ct9H300mP27_12090 [Chloroflexota bacterium]